MQYFLDILKIVVVRYFIKDMLKVYNKDMSSGKCYMPVKT